MNNRFYNHQLIQLFLSHLREMLREPGVLFWGIVFPILMSLGLGIAFSNKKDIQVNIALIEKSGFKGNRQDVDLFIRDFLLVRNAIQTVDEEKNKMIRLVVPDTQLGNTTFIFRGMSWNQAMVLLKRGNVSLAITLEKGKPFYHFDPLNPDAQLVYLKLTRIFGMKELTSMDDNPEIKSLTVQGTRYIDFLVPGLIAMGIMMSSMWGISYSIIEKRSKKLLRRMIATPMKRSYFLVALITVRFFMNLVEGGLLFLFSWMAFGISIQGNIMALFCLFVAGNIAFAGLSILISCHTSNTEIGNGLINLVVMPMMVLSGIFFSYHNFPDWSIAFIQILPLTMMADGFRSIFIEGAGIMDVAIPVVVMSMTGIICFTIGLKIFKWH